MDLVGKQHFGAIHLWIHLSGCLAAADLTAINICTIVQGHTNKWREAYIRMQNSKLNINSRPS